MSGFPYADRYAVHRTLPEEGTAKEVVLDELAAMSAAENPTWEGGQCSGTMYCGDHDHYDYLNEAFSHFSYVNSLQRDMCPSSTKFEAEVIAMTLDLLGAAAPHRDDPGGAGDLGRFGVDRARGVGVPRAPADVGASEHDQTRDGAPGLFQGRSPLRGGDAHRARRPRDDPGRPGLGGGPRR
jgi:hypothetical protein